MTHPEPAAQLVTGARFDGRQSEHRAIEFVLSTHREEPDADRRPGRLFVPRYVFQRAAGISHSTMASSLSVAMPADSRSLRHDAESAPAHRGLLRFQV